MRFEQVIDHSIREYIGVVSPSIDGWLHTVSAFMIPTIDYAQKQKGFEGDILEIGVWQGKTLLLFQRLTRSFETVHGFDLTFVDQLHSNIDKFKDGSRGSISLTEIDSKTLIAKDVCAQHRNGVRLFHVDGYHNYETARSDLRLATQVTNANGVILLDDFFSPTVPGVTQAFFNLLESGDSNNFVPFALGGAKAWLCHASLVDFYRESLFQLMPMPCNNGVDVDFLFGRKIAVYDLW